MLGTYTMKVRNGILWSSGWMFPIRILLLYYTIHNILHVKRLVMGTEGFNLDKAIILNR